MFCSTCDTSWDPVDSTFCSTCDTSWDPVDRTFSVVLVIFLYVKYNVLIWNSGDSRGIFRTLCCNQPVGNSLYDL